MNKIKFYLLLFLVAYAFLYYVFLRHLNLNPMIISAIPVVVAVISISSEGKYKRSQRDKKNRK